MSFTPKKVAMALLLATLPTLFALAQTPQEVRTIIKDYDVSLLQEMADRFTDRAEREKAEAVALAQQRGLEVRMTLEDGGVAELMRVLPDGTLIYYRTDNVDAARSTRANHLNIGGSLGLNLDGQNMIAGVWDGGHALVTHQEYDGPGGTDRVTSMDGPNAPDFHAAHVTGTIMASGVVPQAKGMAPRSRVNGYDWSSDTGEVATAAGNGLLLSNHSYGYQAPGIPNQWFGAYREDARDFDNIMYNAPYYLTVISAGNDGLDNTSNASPLQGNPGYDKLSGMKTSKNAMIVANAQDATVDSNGNLISVSINGTSSQGPTDDFRIKPDISGNGTGVYSTYETSNTAYNSISGTSMAAPNVTGSLLLLQEHANNVTGDYLRAATLKGLALHTADDAGPEGPDVVWGWGLMHTKRAAETINENGSSTLIQELTLSQGQTYSIQVEADSYQDLMASISWTDPAGTVNNGTNSPTPALVNDLDIRITQNGDTFYPWRLTGITTNSNDGDNIVDPYERVEVSEPSGTYTITVTHKGTLSGSQQFSLIVTGILVECTLATVPENVQSTGVTTTTASLNWDPIPGALFDLRYRKSGTTTWTLIEDIPQANATLTGLTLLTEYEVQVRSKCPGEPPTAYAASVFFTTGDYCNAGADDPDFEKIANVTFNTINNNSSSTAGYEDFTAISTPVSRGATYSFTASSPESYTGDQVIVWIDFNQNGDFSDPGEQVLVTTPGGSPWTGNISIPTGATLGETRMRIRLHDTDFGSNSTPCGDSQYGQVEDYTVVVYDDYVYYNSSWTPADPSGVSTSSDNILVEDGTTTLTGTTVANTLTVQQGAQLNIEGVLNAQGDITNEGTLVFVSNATTTGQLDSFSGTITGDVVVQRYIPAKRAFRLLSSSVTTAGSIRDHWQEGVNNPDTATNLDPNPGFGTHITGSQTGENGFDATPSGNHSLFVLDNPNQQWQAVTNTDVNTLDAGTPYRVLVRGDRSINVTSNSALPTNTTLRMTGNMHTGPWALTDMSTVGGGINFFGNPYQASVDMNAVISASSNVNPAFYYVWDPTLGGIPTPGEPGGRGAYVTVQLPAGTNTSGSAANQYLQPGQAAFVATLNNGAASLNFQESHKEVSAPLTAVFSNDSRIDLRLYEAASFGAGSTPSDGLRLIFSEDYSNAITSVDAPKFYNQDENLASMNEDNLYSIENRALPEAGETIPLFTNQYRNTEYVFEIARTDVAGVTAYLRDHYAGTDTELMDNDTTIYAFNVDPADPNSIAEDRFEIVFDVLLATHETAFGSGFVLFPNPLQGDAFYIATRNLVGQSVNVEVHNMLGQPVIAHSQTVGPNGRVEVKATQLTAGIYTVSLSTEDGNRFTAKLITK